MIVKMRENLLRGKSKKNNIWMEGSLLILNDEHFYIVPKTVIEESDMSLTTLLSLNFIDVYPETLGQYTGKVDADGKRIFEGDILELYPYSEKWIVYWDEKELMYKIYSREGGDMPLSVVQNPTVIGNLWDVENEL